MRWSRQGSNLHLRRRSKEATGTDALPIKLLPLIGFELSYRRRLRNPSSVTVTMATPKPTMPPIKAPRIGRLSAHQAPAVPSEPKTAGVSIRIAKRIIFVGVALERSYRAGGLTRGSSSGWSGSTSQHWSQMPTASAARSTPCWSLNCGQRAASVSENVNRLPHRKHLASMRPSYCPGDSTDPVILPQKRAARRGRNLNGSRLREPLSIAAALSIGAILHPSIQTTRRQDTFGVLADT
jgi:hypothetical protein